MVFCKWLRDENLCAQQSQHDRICQILVVLQFYCGVRCVVADVI